MSAVADLPLALIHAVDAVRYARYVGMRTSDGYDPSAWQQLALQYHQTSLLLCNRQDGKSTTMAVKCVHKARFMPDSLSLVFSASERQAKELLLKARAFVKADPDIELDRDNGSELRLTNDSRIVALPATDNTTRGYTDPDLLIYDEAAQTPDSLFYMSSGMVNDRPGVEMMQASTPFGKRGFFWEAWNKGEAECKIFARVPYDFRGGEVVDAIPEDRFRKKWAERGVSAFYSNRKSRRWLIREMREYMIPEAWMRQEHACEFLDVMNAIIPYEYFEAAVAAGVGIEPLFKQAVVSNEVQLLEFGKG